MSFEPLTPAAFLLRAGTVHADRLAVVDGGARYSYAQFLDRALRLAGALRALGVTAGDRVAVLAPNTHVLLETHYGVPFAGAVLVALNPRLTAQDLAGIVKHSGASVLIYDRDFEDAAVQIGSAAGPSLKRIQTRPHPNPPPEAKGTELADEYEAMLAAAAPYRCEAGDERGLLAINYTSGTTGSP